MRRTAAGPTRQSVHELLEELLGRDVTVRSLPAPFSIPRAGPVAVGFHRLDSGEPAGACLADLPAVCRLGAALSAVPPEVAEESVRTREVAAVLRENYQEILNIAAQLFRTRGRPGRPTTDLWIGPARDLPEDVRERCGAPSSRLDLRVDVAGYGAGRLALLWLGDPAAPPTAPS